MYQTHDITLIRKIEENHTIVCHFVHYEQAVNPKIIVGLNSLASEQEKPTEIIMKEVQQLLK